MMEVSIQVRSIGKGGGGLPLLFLAANLYIKKLNDHGVAPPPPPTHTFLGVCKIFNFREFFFASQVFFSPTPYTLSKTMLRVWYFIWNIITLRKIVLNLSIYINILQYLMTEFIFYCRKRIPFRQNMPCHRTMTTPIILQMPGKSQIYTFYRKYCLYSLKYTCLRILNFTDVC